MNFKIIILLLYITLIISDTKKPSDDFQQFVNFGSYKVTHINDGKMKVKPKLFFSESTDSFWEQNKEFLDEDGNLSIYIGGFLLETKNQKVLMDLGIGPEKIYLKGVGNVSGGGLFLKNLEKAGVKPEQITDVFFSHLHQDNIGWATTKKNDKYVLTFPKAKYWCNKFEWEYFEKDIEKAELEIFKDLKTKFYEPIKGVMNFIQEGKELAPGLYPIGASGHSPALTLLKLEAKEQHQNLWFISDIFHSLAEFKDVELLPDVDHSKFAKETRIIILPEFCKPYGFIANARFGPFAFGKLHDVNRTLTWEPCTTKECKLYLEGDGYTIAFQDEDL